MSDQITAYGTSEPDDFQRWFFGGSPPESDAWDRHAFEDALGGAASSAALVALARSAHTRDFVREAVTPWREPLSVA